MKYIEGALLPIRHIKIQRDASAVQRSHEDLREATRKVAVTAAE